MKLLQKRILAKFPILAMAAAFLFSSSVTLAQDGKELFKANCAACHKTSSQPMVGPGLAGINEKRSEEWLMKWIKNSQEMVNAGDADAVAIFNEFKKAVMPPISLSDGEIKAILTYVGSAATETAAVATAGSASAAPVKAPEGLRLSKEEKWLLTGLGILFLIVLYYVWSLKQLMRKLGYAGDKKPLKDQMDELIKRNGRLIVVCCVIGVLFILKIWISGMGEAA